MLRWNFNREVNYDDQTDFPSTCAISGRQVRWKSIRIQNSGGRPWQKSGTKFCRPRSDEALEEEEKREATENFGRYVDRRYVYPKRTPALTNGDESGGLALLPFFISDVHDAVLKWTIDTAFA